MKINTEIKINVNWNEEEKVNKNSFNIDVTSTPSIVLIALEMTKNAISDLLENHIKASYPNGKCTEKELKNIMNTKFENIMFEHEK